MFRWIKSLFTGVYVYGKPATGRFIVVHGTLTEQMEQTKSFLEGSDA